MKDDNAEIQDKSFYDIQNLLPIPMPIEGFWLPFINTVFEAIVENNVPEWCL